MIKQRISSRDSLCLDRAPRCPVVHTYDMIHPNLVIHVFLVASKCENKDLC
jgi:hypothetical protein